MERLNILITGGAGYIGSHIAKELLETTNHKITIIDNLSTGFISTIESLKRVRDFDFIELDLKRFKRVREILQKKRFDTIIHFAASIVVPESLKNPIKYYMNNTINTTNLIKSADESGVKRFIFSSTAAVYGEPKEIPERGINEEMATNPINPYGMSKLMSEKILQDTAKVSKNLKYVIFRYFNVAGASKDLLIGEKHNPETHLIPLIAKTALKEREEISIFGDDYPTKDGTNIRDFIDIDDLANAHIMAIDYLKENESDIFNCGYGRGFSVKEVIDTFKEATEEEFRVKIAPRREGDPAILIADSRKIKAKMGWKPKYENLKLICKMAYEWEKRQIKLL